MIIKLVRHGESQSNAGNIDASVIGDHNVSLTDLGIQQAEKAGEKIGSEFICDGLVYTSPYLRARQTVKAIMNGAKCACLRGVPKIYEDPLLREMEWGWNKNQDDKRIDEDNRNKFGYFYYRIPGGESGADCYDRICIFLESLHRQAKRKKKSKILIVTHGITIRAFVMRWFHLKVEEYNSLHNPQNGDIITIAALNSHYWFSSRLGVDGLRFRDCHNVS
jgi:broad specificity phosphatase PhoE